MVKFFKYQKFLLYILILLAPNVVYASVNNQESYIINNNELIIYDNEYKNLENLGFTELEILNMNVEELEQNKNLKGTVVAQNTTNLKDDNTNFPSIELLGLQVGNSNNVEKKLTTTIVLVNGNYRYKVTVEWSQIPVNRSYDIIGIGIDSNVKVSSTPFFKQTFCTSGNNCSSSSEYSKKVTSSGASATYLLPSSKSITSMNAYFYFDVSKNTNSTITKLNAYGDYAHSTNSVSEVNALNHNINRSGIVHLNSTSKYFDTFNLSKAIWTGSW